MSAYITVARCWWLLGQHRWVGECLGSSSQRRCVKKNEKYHVFGKNIQKDRFIINDVNRLNHLVEWLVGTLSAYFNIKQQTSRARTEQNPHACEGGRGSRYGGQFGAYKSIYLYNQYIYIHHIFLMSRIQNDSLALFLSLAFSFSLHHFAWSGRYNKRSSVCSACCSLFSCFLVKEIDGWVASSTGQATSYCKFIINGIQRDVRLLQLHES